MAVRSSSGTGVIVSLVVFVLCTFFLLVLTIVFYSGKNKAEEQAGAADATLAKYVTREQRNRDEIKALEDRANPTRGDSVVSQLMKSNAEVMGYLAGDPQANVANVRGDFARRYGVAEDGSVNAHLGTVRREMSGRETEIQGLQQRVADREGEIQELETRIDNLNKEHQEELAAVQRQLDTYRGIVEQYRNEVQEVKGEYYSAIDRHRDDYEGRILELENEKDHLHQETAQLRGRVEELQEALQKNRVRAQNPAALVDGRVIETTGRDQVFIDRGRRHRVTLGMTFEVYEDASALQAEGDLPRGKASLEVIKVADSTSTCKITRSIPGRPVVRNDVIANAVYDPNYTFKFMVHGNFDVDQDGRATPGEADHLSSQIVEWGGAVVTGDSLPGDLDFLLLGVEPPMPLPLPHDATTAQVRIWQEKRLAYEQYQELFRQAREAQIPVLNANRFYILIGYTDR